jgi:RNA polymerase sigma-70 factor (ECF subfamily)
VTAADERALVDRLRSGDEAAFVGVVNRYHESMVRVASAFVPSRSIAEEVAQETWAAALRGLDRFEGRSSLRTWLFAILVNRAKSAGAREPRTVSLDGPDGPGEERFSPGGAWSEPPDAWPDDVVERLSAPQLVGKVLEAITDLPDTQRQVVTLRDVEGLTSGEVCQMLGLSEANQRVALHRGRTRIRTALAAELEEV